MRKTSRVMRLATGCLAVTALFSYASPVQGVALAAAPEYGGRLGSLSGSYADAASVSPWAADAMANAAAQGYVQGSNGRLNPQTAVTRAEFAKLLTSALGLSASPVKTNGFADVSADKWFYGYVNTAYQAGFVSGYGNRFNPNESITREQMASIVARALRLEAASEAEAKPEAEAAGEAGAGAGGGSVAGEGTGDGGEALADLGRVSGWAEADVRKTLAYGIMQGQGDRFAPFDSVTREMAVVVVMRASDYRLEHPIVQAEASERQEIVRRRLVSAAAYLQRTVASPAVSSIGGEWTIVGLARSGEPIDPAYYAKYEANLMNALVDAEGNLHSVKYTEYDRVILALTALGKRADEADGFDLLAKLADYEQLIKQGVNGPIFALLALDSKGYAIPQNDGVKTQTTRELLVDFILNREIAGGGWALGAKETVADPDVTAMALQALTPYYDSSAEARSAVDRGVALLSAAQLADGGFASAQSVNSQSVAQVVIALTGLGIDPGADARFVKNGRSALDALLGFADVSGGFYPILAGGIASGGSEPGIVDTMATEQALLALVAYDRYASGSGRLYDMTDV
ncbi:S-layer homology domain-containing protein [Cohnella fermenti]|uniref:SLH domain-containing protein n=1 Tax=Cohnella fermenti TaxID=2565925 RepID=A0A4S4BY95_9BACL|nr:S-layer homology domain-containing protein [Cohnella fermenti]THF79512.1 hypothetical protein E6C55_12050 [Cohnella fermenti]